MSERRPRVALCAALTWDGKLDAAGPPPRALLDFLRPAAGDARLIDESLARQTSPDWAQPVKILDLDCLADLAGSRALEPAFDAYTVRRWLCLGGPRLFRALLDAGRVNGLYLLLRPRVDARRDAPTLSGTPTPAFFPQSVACRLRRMEVVGGECLLHYTIPRLAA